MRFISLGSVHEPVRLGRGAVRVGGDLLRRLDQKKLTARGKHFAFGKLPEALEREGRA